MEDRGVREVRDTAELVRSNGDVAVDSGEDLSLGGWDGVSVQAWDAESEGATLLEVVESLCFLTMIPPVPAILLLLSLSLSLSLSFLGRRI